jgi:hypothetical protein
MHKKNPHAVAMGRKGGAATKGIRTKKKLASIAKARAVMAAMRAQQAKA